MIFHLLDQLVLLWIDLLHLLHLLHLLDLLYLLHLLHLLHLSLGAKHGIYPKPGFKRNDGKHHVDVFAVTECLTLDDKVVYRNGAWVV